MLRLGIALLMCLDLSNVAFAQSATDASLQNTLFGLSRQFMTNWQKHDAVALAASLAPEFVYVGPHGPTSRDVVTRDLVMHCALASYSFGQPRMLTTAPDSAVLIYSIHQDLTCFGQPDSPDVVNTDTFVRRGGKWLFLMTTSTPLAAK